MPIIRCPHCDDNVEIEDEWYGRRIRCPNCDRTFTPERDRPRRGYDSDREDDRPRRSRYANDDPPPRRRSRYDSDPPQTGGGLKWVLVSFAVFGLLVCGGCVGVVAWFMNAKASFTDPWVDQSVGDTGVVTASFPKTPLPKYLTVPASTDGQGVGYDHSTDGKGGLDAITFVGYYDFPAGTDPLGPPFLDIRHAVEEEFQVAPVVKADIASDRKTTIGGFPAREVTYSKEDGGYTLQVVNVTGGRGGPVRAVVVFVGGMHMKDEDKQKFLNSVRIGGRK